MFAPKAETESLLTELRRFVAEKVQPLETPFLRGAHDAFLAGLSQCRRQARDLGYWLPQLPAEHGGMGLSLVEHAYVSEVLGRTIAGHHALNCQAPDAGNMEILIEYGTDEQKERFLEPLLDGNVHSCFAMTEPEHPGSNPTWLSTRAVADGDDYVINGHKWFSTAADGAAFAIVMAVTHPDAPKHARASMLLVPMDHPGVEHVQNISVMGERGSGWASHAELRFTDCRVPKQALLGPEGLGFVIAQQRLGPGRIHHTMRWIGIAERCLDLMCRQAVQREVAPGSRLSDQGRVQEWIAESRAEIHAARLVVLDAAHRIDAGGLRAARVEISVAKFLVAGMLQRVMDRALQVHGALGMTDELPIAYWYRHERAARIYDGPDETHKRSVARYLLRAYQ